MVHIRGQCHDRHEVLGAVPEHLFAGRIRIARQGTLCVRELDAEIFRSLLIRRKERALGPGLNSHICHGHAGGKAHGLHRVADKLERAVGCPRRR